MPRISEIWRTRLLLIGLGMLSLAPFILQQMLNASAIYDIRLVGGERPVDVIVLQTIGQCSVAFPAIFAGLLLTSAIRPTALTRLLLGTSIAIFLLYLILFLVQAIHVLELRVPEHYVPIQHPRVSRP
jgi:hypothetical protein